MSLHNGQPESLEALDPRIAELQRRAAELRLAQVEGDTHNGDDELALLLPELEKLQQRRRAALETVTADAVERMSKTW